MDPTTQLGHLLGLAGACAQAADAGDVVTSALPALISLSDADAALLVRRSGDGVTLVSHDGRQLEAQFVAEAEAHAQRGRLTSVPVPEAWQDAGVARVAAQRLPGHTGVLILAWGSGSVTVGPALEMGLATIDAALGRTQAERDLADLSARVDNAQHLANMGDYDWHIPTDTNRWSDQLYRIYGHEPQSFNPSYERFMSLIHPDDRERITAVHQQAYATGEAYGMMERIVRPDGEVRYLSSNGEVVMGEDGTPVRMRGTCLDVTDRVLAEQEREQHVARFQSLVASAPDAILVLDQRGRVVHSNPQAHALLGGDPADLPVSAVLPGEVAEAHGVPARTLDGRDAIVDATVVILADAGEGEMTAVFLRDAAPRMAGEAMAARLGEAQLRRRQALEINDNVVQGLVAAAYALEHGATGEGATYLQQTLSAARAMMDDLLEPLDGEGLRPGDLVRSSAATLGAEVPQPEEPVPAQPAPAEHRVLVVDDADDLRALVRMRVERHAALTVVGEASDGEEAVERARALQPDLVLLDLAMPRMDGLEALPLIKQAVPGVRVIVLSGFNQSSLAERAISAGADRYVVKGGSLNDLLVQVHEVLAAA